MSEPSFVRSPTNQSNQQSTSAVFEIAHSQSLTVTHSLQKPTVTHSLNHSLTHSLTHSVSIDFVRLFVRLFVCSLVRSLVRSFVGLVRLDCALTTRRCLRCIGLLVGRCCCCFCRCCCRCLCRCCVLRCSLLCVLINVSLQTDVAHGDCRHA